MIIELKFSYPLVISGYLSLYYIYASLPIRKKNQTIERANKKS